MVEGVGVCLHEDIPFAYQYQAYALPVIYVEQTLASLVLLVDRLLGGGALATLAWRGRALVTGLGELVCGDAVCGACVPPRGGRGRYCKAGHGQRGVRRGWTQSVCRSRSSKGEQGRRGWGAAELAEFVVSEQASGALVFVRPSSQRGLATPARSANEGAVFVGSRAD